MLQKIITEAISDETKNLFEVQESVSDSLFNQQDFDKEVKEDLKKICEGGEVPEYMKSVTHNLEGEIDKDSLLFKTNLVEIPYKQRLENQRWEEIFNKTSVIMVEIIIRLELTQLNCTRLLDYLNYCSEDDNILCDEEKVYDKLIMDFKNFLTHSEISSLIKEGKEKFGKSEMTERWEK